jgi:hypothetical protein
MQRLITITITITMRIMLNVIGFIVRGMYRLRVSWSRCSGGWNGVGVCFWGVVWWLICICIWIWDVFIRYFRDRVRVRVEVGYGLFRDVVWLYYVFSLGCIWQCVRVQIHIMIHIMIQVRIRICFYINIIAISIHFYIPIIIKVTIPVIILIIILVVPSTHGLTEPVIILLYCIIIIIIIMTIWMMIIIVLVLLVQICIYIFFGWLKIVYYLGNNCLGIVMMYYGRGSFVGVVGVCVSVSV